MEWILFICVCVCVCATYGQNIFFINMDDSLLLFNGPNFLKKIAKTIRAKLPSLALFSNDLGFNKHTYTVSLRINIVFGLIFPDNYFFFIFIKTMND